MAEETRGELGDTYNAWWRCPKCGLEAGHPDMPSHVKFSPPTCGMGHKPCEMEQIVQGGPFDV